MAEPLSSQRSGALHFSLFHDRDLAVDFGHDAQAALAYMAKHADDLDEEAGLLAFDERGMCQVALVDARHVERTTTLEGEAADRAEEILVDRAARVLFKDWQGHFSHVQIDRDPLYHDIARAMLRAAGVVR